jgi:hypothetical protein
MVWSLHNINVFGSCKGLKRLLSPKNLNVVVIYCQHPCVEVPLNNLRFPTFDATIWCGCCDVLVIISFSYLEEHKRFVLFYFILCALCLFVIINPMSFCSTYHAMLTLFVCVFSILWWLVSLFKVSLNVLIVLMNNKLLLTINLVFLVGLTIIWHLHNYWQVLLKVSMLYVVKFIITCTSRNKIINKFCEHSNHHHIASTMFFALLLACYNVVECFKKA